MYFLYFLEGLRSPFLDAVVSAITLFGEETIFMAVAMLIFWCFDKYQGYYLLCTGFLGTVINQFLKMAFRVPRPWVRDTNFTIVESAREAATGYSFPSGHTQTSVGLFGGMARWNKNTTLWSVCLALCILVPFSRLYLGVHTPADVLTSVIIAVVLVLVGYPIFKKAAHCRKLMYAILGLFALAIVGQLCFLYFYNFPDDAYAAENIANLISAKKNAFTLLGCVVGLIVVYTADTYFIDFPTKAVWWAQIIKSAVGFILVIAVKEGLRAPLDAIFDGNLIARAVRYFFIVIVAGLFWPLTFKWFSSLGRKK